jgi:hypothetical protein
MQLNLLNNFFALASELGIIAIRKIRSLSSEPTALKARRTIEQNKLGNTDFCETSKLPWAGPR